MGSPVTIPNPAPGCSYLNYPRAVLNTPHPIYGGNLAGFGVGDLPTQFESGIPVFNAITANATSGLIDVAANAIELTATFSDLHTSCTITVFLADGETVVATWNNVSTLHSGNLYAGFAEQRKLIGGGSLVFQVSNYDGSGSITLLVKRTG
jgi:hypothetical protein